MATFWLLFGYFFGYFLATFWLLFGYFLATFLATFSKILGDFFPILPVTVYRKERNIMKVSQRLFSG